MISKPANQPRSYWPMKTARSYLRNDGFIQLHQMLSSMQDLQEMPPVSHHWRTPNNESPMNGCWVLRPWDPDALALYRESQATGISRILWGSPAICHIWHKVFLAFCLSAGFGNHDLYNHGHPFIGTFWIIPDLILDHSRSHNPQVLPISWLH